MSTGRFTVDQREQLRLEFVRLIFGEKQKRIASILCCSTTQVQRYIRGEATPSADVYRELSLSLECPLSAGIFRMLACREQWRVSFNDLGETVMCSAPWGSDERTLLEWPLLIGEILTLYAGRPDSAIDLIELTRIRVTIRDLLQHRRLRPMERSAVYRLVTRYRSQLTHNAPAPGQQCST